MKFAVNIRAVVGVAGALALAGPGWGQVADHGEHAGVEHLASPPVQKAAIIGAAGFLDYEFGVEPQGGAPAPLFSAAGGDEPAEALLPYQSRGRRVEINWGALEGLANTENTHLSIPLFDGQERELVFVHSEYRSATSYSWFGQIAGVPASDFILVRHDTAVYMIVRDYDHKEEFELQYQPAQGGMAAGHAIRALSRAPSDQRCGTCDGQIGPPAEPPTHQPGGGYGSRSVSDPTNRVDVMFLATAEALAGFGSADAFVTQSQACVDDFNLSASNCHINLTMRVAMVSGGAYSYHEDSDGSTDLRRLTASADGYMDNIHDERDLYRADIVTLFRQTRWNINGGSSTVGVGWRAENMASLSSGVGFNVVCRTAGSVVGTFSHEAGHNFGACHHAGQNDCATAVTSSPHGKQCTCNRVVCYDYWHTTMAYSQSYNSCSSDTRLPVFSQPGLFYRTPFGCSDIELGDSESNVSGLLDTTKSTVSQWRIAANQIWTYAPNGFGGDGTRYNPVGRITIAVLAVQGGAAEGVVRCLPGTYVESNGSSVLWRNPCVVVVAEGNSVVVR